MNMTSLEKNRTKNETSFKLKRLIPLRDIAQEEIKKIILFGSLILLFVLLDLTMFSAIFVPEVFQNYAEHSINYDFYMLVRWVTVLTTISIAILLYMLEFKKYIIFPVIVIIIFNPIVPIHLTKYIWITIDLLVIMTTVIAPFIYIKERNKALEISYNPQKFVALLTNFTTDNPLKYTTHTWDYGDMKKTHGDFQGFLNAITGRWGNISEELKELSPHIYQKINTFLLNTDVNADSWCSQTDISVGWSSLDGLEEWSNKGNKPSDFELKETYVVNNQTISTFGEVINLFKKEIEIRSENNMLEEIFLQQKNKLGRKFIVDLIKLKGRMFYTDVETLENTIDRIFVEIKKRENLNHVEVEVIEPDEKSIAIKITHMDSTSGKDAVAMLEEAKDGDFKIMKDNLQNLCDWSIESSYEGENYRVNYLKDSNTEDLENLLYTPEGFTHILRFYKK